MRRPRTAEAHERGTIFLEAGARARRSAHFDGEQLVLRLEAPRCAAHATPGSFAHLACDRDDPDAPATVDHAGRRGGRLDRHPLQGERCGPARASRVRAGDSGFSVLGPIGRGFTPTPSGRGRSLDRRRRRHPAHGVPGRALARATDAAWQPLVLMGSESPVSVPHPALDHRWCPAARRGIACMPLLEELGRCRRGLRAAPALPAASTASSPSLRAAWLAALASRALARSRSSPAARLPCSRLPRRLARRHFVAVPGGARGVHGVRGRRLRRLRGGSADAGGAGHEARVRGRPGIRCRRGVSGLSPGGEVHADVSQSAKAGQTAFNPLPNGELTGGKDVLTAPQI